MMGRFETLNEQTQDVVTALIPSIATNFGVSNLVDSIPQDIRMRKWDCDRKEHIIDQSEDDPRNWGVQFLKDLLTISRHKMGKVDEFQSDLRMKLQKVRGLHGWVRLQDIKDLKNKYLGKEEPQVDSDSNDGGVISDEDSLASLSFGEEVRSGFSILPSMSSLFQNPLTSTSIVSSTRFTRSVVVPPRPFNPRSVEAIPSVAGWSLPLLAIVTALITGSAAIALVIIGRRSASHFRPPSLPTCPMATPSTTLTEASATSTTTASRHHI
ncbi:hypothetical protein EJ04DRAFT_213129 [Polyplosphaeria fusca]|uniref:Uncharacterized protein n=1 Tax=Polyplosphaeria fusca TaxID=682080 RepID=A0A9P4RC32_9PLEO|nr:hypothetical protein EJ04DRAFT_213129 [Polyplosphaeria fusca]